MIDQTFSISPQVSAFPNGQIANSTDIAHFSDWMDHLALSPSHSNEGTSPMGQIMADQSNAYAGAMDPNFPHDMQTWSQLDVMRYIQERKNAVNQANIGLTMVQELASSTRKAVETTLNQK